MLKPLIIDPALNNLGLVHYHFPQCILKFFRETTNYTSQEPYGNILSALLL